MFSNSFFDNPFGADKRSFIKHIEQYGFRGREISVDNKLLELFFTDFDGLYAHPGQAENLEAQKRVEEICYITENMLPEIEKQVIILIFFLKKKQEAVGRILKVTQEMVCYYKNRALLRIRLLYFFRNIDINDMEIFLKDHVTKKQRIAMIEYFKDHDLRRVAKKISQMEDRKTMYNYEAIGSRIKLGLKKLKNLMVSKDKNLVEKAEKYHKVFTLLKTHNSLHHTQSKKQVPREIQAR
jgi:hypothetical protein